MTALQYAQCENETNMRGVTKTIRIIGSKWTLHILHALCERTKRFGELQKELAGISPRTLSLRLQELEKDKIVKKHIFAEVPPHVEYSLTKKGSSLKKMITFMKEWGEEN